MYVSPGSVYVASNAIYININGEFIAVESISSDASGVYFKSHQILKICLRCGIVIEPNGHICPKQRK
jgi:hypothetical protein